MICKNCKNQMSDGATFCGICGATLERNAEVTEAKDEPSVDALLRTVDPQKESAKATDVSFPSKDQRPKGRRVKSILTAAMAAILLAGGVFAVYAHNQGIIDVADLNPVAVLNPQLTEQQVEQDIRESGIESSHALRGNWENIDFDLDEDLRPIDASLEGLSIVSISDIDIVKSDDGITAETVAQIHLASETLEVMATVERSYRQVDGEWLLRSDSVTDREFTPLMPLSAEEIAQRITTYFSVLDGEAEVETSGWGEPETVDTLRSLYAGVTDFPVTAELLNPQGNEFLTKVEVTLANESNLYTLSGKMQVNYRFNVESAQWVLWTESLTVDESARERDFGVILGEWRGEYQSTAESSGTQDRCLGGSETVPVLVIQEIDLTNRILVGTLSGLAHNHERPRNTVQSSSGDIAFPATQFIADLRIEANSITFTDVSIIDRSERFGRVIFSGSIEFVDGTIQGTIASGVKNATPSGLLGWTLMRDAYIFTRVE